MPDSFRAGQRWISESEPELGLGSILKVSDRTVTALFGASNARREYARHNAPLRRVRFHAGDTIQSKAGKTIRIQGVSERDGLLYYHGTGQELCETELSDTISFNKPEERLFAGQVDSPAVFDLRVAALQYQHQRRKSKVRGFAGGRIDLIPHQLYIASEVAGRLVPRVLLADEVGLGKTIEACLILHRLILTGRVQRALILVPESLVHQWFVELLRRFNLWFHIFDEDRCQSIASVNPGANPFLDDQLVLCSIGLFGANRERATQALEAGWDMLVVDEAHHLNWTPDQAGPEYTLVEELSRNIPGLLLLTATPEQLGVASHFARLRLLDSDRFFDLNEFIAETRHYRTIAHDAAALAGKELEDLLDRHGTGRVAFRNTRATISGFPQRTVHLAALAADSLLDWLADLLRSLDPAKVLLICRTQARVTLVEAGLRQRMKNVKVATFHEGLSLVQRDRNAAWFADDHGAGILICSEIGSEGRNFQFAHHLVLFDLPYDPELVEQHIGRLDRIGPSSTIHVHVPFVVGSDQEVLARWHHEGLNTFEKNLSGGRELFEMFGSRVYKLATTPGRTAQELEELIADTVAARKTISRQLEEGRDRLLELNSFRPEAAAKVIDEIHRLDDDPSIDAFMLAVFEQYSLNVEEIAYRTYKLGSAGIFTDSFPGLPADGFTVTCDRDRALAREDVQFLTWDHPLVNGALDLLLGSEQGNSSFAYWQDPKAQGLYLETVYVLECIAPPQLHADRFLPPTPIRVLVDHQGRSVSLAVGPLKRASDHSLLERPEVREDLLPVILEHSQAAAAKKVPEIVRAARNEMITQLNHEIERLQALRQVNRSVREEEIQLLVDQRDSLNEHFDKARIRLDAIRLIQRGR